MVVTKVQEDEILQLIEAGNTLSAVRKYREYTNADLKTAHDFVTQLSEGIQVTAEEIPEPDFDLELLKSLAFAETKEFVAFSAFLRTLMKDLYGLNYQPTFDTKLIRIPDGDFSPFEVIKKAYPESKPNGRSVSEVTWSDMKTGISEFISNEGDSGSHPAEKMIPRLPHLVETYWNHVGRLVTPEGARIFSYHWEDGLPGCYVFWMFAFFIHDTQKNHCLALVGSCSD